MLITNKIILIGQRETDNVNQMITINKNPTLIKNLIYGAWSY
jgi:hypothetical protein